MESKSITIWIEGGICQDVFNLPEGWQYEVLDTDEGEGQEEAQERLDDLRGDISSPSTRKLLDDLGGAADRFMRENGVAPD